MVKSLRESKAKLSELVERASRGEDVLITVRGKVKARLTRPNIPQTSKSGAQWARELRALQKKYTRPGKPKITIQQALDEIREDRL